jgi:TonB family protein
LAAEELLREKKADQLQTVFARYSVKLTLTVDAAGKITDHNIVEPSPEAVMNQIANTTIARIDPLPEPPVALLNRGYVKIVWVFNVERYRQ